jgi:hypothetical protein
MRPEACVLVVLVQVGTRAREGEQQINTRHPDERALQLTSYRRLRTKSRKQETKSRKQETESRKQETESRKHETESRKQETESRK